MIKSSGIQKRYAAIKSLIQQHVIEDQQTLSGLLHKHYGIKTNQAIISRDLRYLGITKAIVQGKSIYQLPHKDIQLEILNLAIREIAHNDHMVVIKTFPALADFVGDYLDAFEEHGILGTLAGENTVFVIPIAKMPIKEFYKKICNITQFKIPNTGEAKNEK